ncbi:MAG TPA: (Fe-S)-binding protein [Bacteroidia bacterium]|jgi:L-lactate dehydrogenase complex protein LldE|nr:(Fe-S)-binding protein [Bacteroidia bacterium]
MIVDIFIPCFIDQVYPQAALNMVKVLEKAGCDVNYNPEQTCCGQPAFNAGYWEDAKKVGEKFIKEFQHDRYVVCPSASCVGMIKNYYPEMFYNSALHNEYKQLAKNIYEFSSFMVNVLKVTDVGASLDGIATYHDSCAALRECKIKAEPRTLLKNVRGLELMEMKDTESCCGFGGTFSAKFEPIATGMGSDKIKNAMETSAQYIISTDLSCLLHLDGYIKKQNVDIKTMHIADVLASGW